MPFELPEKTKDQCQNDDENALRTFFESWQYTVEKLDCDKRARLPDFRITDKDGRSIVAEVKSRLENQLHYQIADAIISKLKTIPIGCLYILQHRIQRKSDPEDLGKLCNNVQSWIRKATRTRRQSCSLPIPETSHIFTTKNGSITITLTHIYENGAVGQPHMECQGLIPDIAFSPQNYFKDAIDDSCGKIRSFGDTPKGIIFVSHGRLAGFSTAMTMYGDDPFVCPNDDSGCYRVRLKGKGTLGPEMNTWLAYFAFYEPPPQDELTVYLNCHSKTGVSPKFFPHPAIKVYSIIETASTHEMLILDRT